MAVIENPYLWPIRGALVTTLIGALGLATMIVPRYPSLLFTNGLLVGAVIGSAVLFLILGLFGLPYELWLGYEEKKEIASLLAGDPLLHWRYAPDEWRGFAESEWTRARAKVWRLPFIVLCLWLAIGLLVAIVLPVLQLKGLFDFPITHQIRFGSAVFFIGRASLLMTAIVGTVLGVEFGVTEYMKEKDRYRGGMKSPGEVFIGLSGCYMSGVYVPLRGRSRLSSVGIDNGEPAILRLKIEAPVLRRYYTLRQLRVPIPRGKEDEARELLGRVFSQPYGGTALEKPWSPSNLGFFVFLMLNLAMVLFYVQAPQYIPLHGRWGRQFWVMCILFAPWLFGWPNATRFLKWVALLGVVCFGLIAAILQFGPSAHINHLAAATIVVGSLAQIASFVLLALEIRAWKERGKKH